MEDITPTAIQPTIFCKACSVKASEDDIFCTHCGYPLKGTHQEQRNFLSEREAKFIDLGAAQKQINRAANSLFVVGAITAVAGLVYYAISKDPDTKNSLLIINIILGAIYVGLGFWCKSKPLAAIISGASLYVLTIILNAIANPLTIFSGIIFKIVIISFFARGIKSVLESEKLSKDLNGQ
jgi:hypothetical protein